MRQPFCMSSSISTFSPTLPLHSTALYFRAFQNFVFFSFFFSPSRLDSHAMQADATDAKQQQKLSFIPFFPFRYFKKIIFPRFNVFRRLYRAPTAFVFVSHTRKATSKERKVGKSREERLKNEFRVPHGISYGKHHQPSSDSIPTSLLFLFNRFDFSFAPKD